MNKKIINIIISSLNILFVIVLISGVIPGLIERLNSTLEIQYIKNLTNMFQTNIIVIIIWGIINIVNGIINRNNKKLLFWDIVASLSIVQIILSLAVSSYIDECAIIVAIANILVISVFSIKNIVVMIRNHNINKKIITYILSLVFGLIYLITFIENDYVIFVMLATSVWCITMQNIYTYMDNNVENYNKSANIVHIVSLIISICIVSYFSFCIIFKDIVYIIDVNLTNKYQIKLKENLNKICLDESYDSNDIYIPVCKDNKWGYISEDGDEAIECIYDEVTEFFNIRYQTQIDNENYDLLIPVSMVKQENVFKNIRHGFNINLTKF